MRSATTMPPFVELASLPVISVCPKCGTDKESNKRSCCAFGGAWFKKCGNVSDINFDHTWAEGLQACERTLWREDILQYV